MAWNIDWLGFEAFDFGMIVREVPQKFYENAHRALEEVHMKRRDDLLREKSQAKTEGDQELVFGELGWEEELHRLRQQALGSLALDYLASTLRSKLDELKSYLNKARPASLQGYQGPSWLLRVKREYLERFQIDFEKSPGPFAKIEELVLARNAGVHREGDALHEYRNRVASPRFIDQRGEFWVTPQAFLMSAGECYDFIQWVVSELKKLST